MGRQARPQARSDWTSTRGSQRILTPAPVTHTALKPRGRRSQIGLRQEVRNEQGNEGERAPTAATGDRRRVKSPRTRQRWGAKLALGPDHETIATRRSLDRMASADSSGGTSSWESASASHSDGRPPQAPTRLDFDQRSTMSTPSWPSWPQSFQGVVCFSSGPFVLEYDVWGTERL